MEVSTVWWKDHTELSQWAVEMHSQGQKMF